MLYIFVPGIGILLLLFYARYDITGKQDRVHRRETWRRILDDDDEDDVFPVDAESGSSDVGTGQGFASPSVEASQARRSLNPDNPYAPPDDLIDDLVDQ